MPDINRTIENIEAEVAIIRDHQFLDLEGETETAVEVYRLGALRWRWSSWAKVFEKGRKALDKELSALVDIGEAYPLGPLKINHVDTGYFDEAAWKLRCLKNPRDDNDRAAAAAWLAYETARNAAKAAESIRKSGGFKITIATDEAETATHHTDAISA